MYLPLCARVHPITARQTELKEAERVGRESKNSHGFEGDSAASRSEGRYEIKLELKEPYTSTALVANPLLLQLNKVRMLSSRLIQIHTFTCIFHSLHLDPNHKLLLDDTLEIDTFSHVTSLPGELTAPSATLDPGLYNY